MKLLRCGPAGAEKPGLLDDQGRVRDLSEHVGDIAGDVLTPAGLARLAALDPDDLPLMRWLASFPSYGFVLSVPPAHAATQPKLCLLLSSNKVTEAPPVAINSVFPPQPMRKQILTPPQNPKKSKYWPSLT